jgi:hypothetical protein
MAMCAGAMAPAMAVEFGDWLKVDGFGTLGAYSGDDAVAGVRPDPRNPNVSRDGDWRWDGDSLLSAQLTLNPQGKFRLVGQFLAKDDVIKRFKPRAEWFYAAYDVTPNLSLKAGRMVSLSFLLSESRNVNYAQTTARPVATVYTINTVTNLDGLSASWQTSLGGGTLQLDGAAGKSKVSVATGTVDVPTLRSAAIKWSKDAFTVRYARSEFKVDLDFPGTSAALAALASGGTGCINCAAVFAQRIPLKGIKGNIDTVAATYDIGDLTLQAEWAQRLANSAALPDVKGEYVLAGYRLGAFTPFVALGRNRVVEPPLGLQTAPAAPPAAAAANAAFDRFLQGLSGRDTWQLGVRWDFAEGMALKLQYENIRNTQDIKLGQNGTVSYPSPPPIGSYTGPSWDGRVRMTTLNIDFVF